MKAQVAVAKGEKESKIAQQEAAIAQIKQLLSSESKNSSEISSKDTLTDEGVDDSESDLTY